MNGHYTMGVNQAKKEMNITIVGNFTPEQAQKYINDYNKNVNSINASDYVLRLDCSDLNLVTPELVDSLEACYALYKSSGFKSVIFEINNNTVVKMQLIRIARKVNLKVEFVQAA